ncbi:MAG: hypothetical protein F6K39_21385 [Okeania sp. SIO3B3]|nr:hypothetical protein [Okeania sp. SIO3B3]
MSNPWQLSFCRYSAGGLYFAGSSATRFHPNYPLLVANPDTVTTTQGDPPITLDVLANDTGESLNIIVVDNLTQAGNNATISNNQIIYTPLPGFSGIDTFTYEISDGNNNTPNSSATVNVTAKNGGGPSQEDRVRRKERRRKRKNWS